MEGIGFCGVCVGVVGGVGLLEVVVCDWVQGLMVVEVVVEMPEVLEVPGVPGFWVGSGRELALLGFVFVWSGDCRPGHGLVWVWGIFAVAASQCGEAGCMSSQTIGWQRRV